MKPKDMILIALICVNVTLAAAAGVAWLGKSEPAAVAGSATRSGDYVMVSGQVSSSREVLLVIDVVAKRANLYASKPGPGGVTVWEMTSSRNLVSDFAAGR